MDFVCVWERAHGFPIICDPPQLATTEIVVPTSGVLPRNLTGRRLCIRAEGTIAAFTVTKADGATFNIRAVGANYPVMIDLDAYDGGTATFTETPTFSYFSIG